MLMDVSLLKIIIYLLAGIAVIVILTAKYRVHAFFALIISCFVVGTGVQLPFNEVIAAVKDGFGNIMKSLGIIIMLGTTLGVLLEYTGGTRVMAAFILKKVGEGRAPLAMSITGFIIGLPIFCDSGYIVLSGLNNSLAKRTGIPIAVMAVSLATGLYAVHCLIPPHPGAAAAAGILHVDYGRLIMAGILVAVPASAVGFLWARYSGKQFAGEAVEQKESAATAELPSVARAFLPVVIPILLIALKSFIIVENTAANGWLSICLSLGDPLIALSIGVLLAFNCKRNWKRDAVARLLQDSAEKAGGILVIIGAGGAFGAVLAATKVGDHISSSMALGGLGILFPFLLTCVLKTAQGSSTVAIITASSIVQPLSPALGLANGNGPLLCILAMGAGSMMISHANDAYFWVISKFSGLDMKTMLKVYTIATILMGLTAFMAVFILSKVL
jgi:GntP family gluconate:H+ symporter